MTGQTYQKRSIEELQAMKKEDLLALAEKLSVSINMPCDRDEIITRIMANNPDEFS